MSENNANLIMDDLLKNWKRTTNERKKYDE